MRIGGRIDQAVEVLGRTLAGLDESPHDEVYAEVLNSIGQCHMMAGNWKPALEHLEAALELAESLNRPAILAKALTAKGITLADGSGRIEEGVALLRHALWIGEQNDWMAVQLRALHNLSYLANNRDRHVEAVALGEEEFRRAGKMGMGYWRMAAGTQIVSSLLFLGRWDEAIGYVETLGEALPAAGAASFRLFIVHAVLIEARRGDIEAADRRAVAMENLMHSDDPQSRSGYFSARAALHLAQGRDREALAALDRALELLDEVGITNESAKEALALSLEAASSVGDTKRIVDHIALIESLPEGRRPPFLAAQALRFRARLDAAAGEAERADKRFDAAAGIFRSAGMQYWLAVVLVERAEWLATRDRNDAATAQLQEASVLVERLGARPLQERLERLGAVRRQVVR